MARTSNNSDPLHESTVAVHGGEFVDPATRASSPNLVMSATFAPTDVTGFSARDEKDYDGFVYGRVSSPTVRQLEHKLAEALSTRTRASSANGWRRLPVPAFWHPQRSRRQRAGQGTGQGQDRGGLRRALDHFVG